MISIFLKLLHQRWQGPQAGLGGPRPPEIEQRCARTDRLEVFSYESFELDPAAWRRGCRGQTAMDIQAAPDLRPVLVVQRHLGVA